MIKAARKAGRSLVKDFREVENLQVSMKGAGDFVSRADIAAEATARADEQVRQLIEKLQAEIDGKNEPMQLVFGNTND